MFLPASASSRWFGIVISVSTTRCSSSRPRSAWRMRTLPSKPKGLVTTPTVSAPTSRATSAITGAAPVPVPPPRPAVTNTMSAPVSRSRMRSRSSSAASRPRSGFAPQPRPRVMVGAELDPERRQAVLEGLGVGVRGAELHPGEPGADHRVERVAAAAADADHLDAGLELPRFLELEQVAAARPRARSRADRARSRPAAAATRSRPKAWTAGDSRPPRESPRVC